MCLLSPNLQLMLLLVSVQVLQGILEQKKMMWLQLKALLGTSKQIPTPLSC